MPATKMSIDGNIYVGAYAVATDRFTLIGNNVNAKKAEQITKALYTETISTSINDSYLVGLFIAANSNGMLLPDMIDGGELKRLKAHLGDIRISVVDTDLNALRNNILSNDKVAIVNPRFKEPDIHAICETLGVEVIKLGIGGFNTVGANNILTNKGLVVNNRVTEEEMDMVEQVVGMKCEQSTANMGELNIGLCTIANSSGLVIGEKTSGFEYSRIANTLDIQG